MLCALGALCAAPYPLCPKLLGFLQQPLTPTLTLPSHCPLPPVQMQGLTSLHMEHMPHMLQYPAMPEGLPAALWRLPRLRRLSLAGSCVHPSKLKLLAAACGGSLTHLDISTGGSAPCAAACCCGQWHGGGGDGGSEGSCCGRRQWPNGPRQLPGPPYKRLTSLHERDLCEAAGSLRQLQSFCAAGTALPLRVCTAFVAAAPAGRLTSLDLSGCCLEAEHPTSEASYERQAPWQRQLFFSSGARRTLNFDELPAGGCRLSVQVVGGGCRLLAAGAGCWRWSPRLWGGHLCLCGGSRWEQRRARRHMHTA